MAGAKTEDRILYIEPNNLQDTKHDNIPFNYEDYCIAVDIEVVVPNRYDCGQQNKFNLVTRDATKTISFLGGTDGMLTTSFTDISGLGEDSKGNRETLGIKSIHIEYQNYYFPSVKIEFTDVKGNSLMQPEEESFVKSLKDNSEVMTQGSFFRSLFSFPYPMFKLKVKGFYGKPITYNLSVSDFSAKFNSENGNFDVTVSFIGYMYGIYADLPFKYLVMAPYINYPSIKGSYWAQESTKKNGKYRFSDGTPMPTLVDVRARIVSSSSNLSKLLTTTESSDKYEKTKNKLQVLKDISSKYQTLTDLFSARGYVSDGKYYFIPGTLGNNDEIRITIKSINELTNSYNNQKDSGETQINTNTLKAASVCYTFNGGQWTSSRDTVPANFQYTGDSATTVESKSRGRDIINKYGTSNTSISGVFYEVESFRVLLNRKISTITELLNKLKEDVNKEQTNKAKDVLGFVPSVKNIVHLVFAHLDCFMHEFYYCLGLVKDNNRSLKDLGIRVDNTDLKQSVGNNSFVPPFPLISNNATKEIEYPSKENTINSNNMPELDLIEEFLKTSQGVSNAINLANENFEYFPALLTDLLYGKNPYALLNSGANLKEDILTMFLHRLFMLISMQMDGSNGLYAGNNTNDKIKNAVKSFATTEAYNAFSVYRLNSMLKKEFKTNVDEKEIDCFLQGKQFNGGSLGTLKDNGTIAYDYQINGKAKAFANLNGNDYTYNWILNNNIFPYFQNFQDILSLIDENFDLKDNEKVYPIGISTETHDNLPTLFEINDGFNLSEAKSAFTEYSEIIKQYNGIPEGTVLNAFARIISDTEKTETSNEISSATTEDNIKKILTSSEYWAVDNTEKRGLNLLTIIYGKSVTKDILQEKTIAKVPKIELLIAGGKLLQNPDDNDFASLKWPVKNTLIQYYMSWIYGINDFTGCGFSDIEGTLGIKNYPDLYNAATSAAVDTKLISYAWRYHEGTLDGEWRYVNIPKTDKDEFFKLQSYATTVNPGDYISGTTRNINIIPLSCEDVDYDTFSLSEIDVEDVQKLIAATNDNDVRKLVFEKENSNIKIESLEKDTYEYKNTNTVKNITDKLYEKTETFSTGCLNRTYGNSSTEKYFIYDGSSNIKSYSNKIDAFTDAICNKNGMIGPVLNDYIYTETGNTYKATTKGILREKDSEGILIEEYLIYNNNGKELSPLLRDRSNITSANCVTANIFKILPDDIKLGIINYVSTTFIVTDYNSIFRTDVITISGDVSYSKYKIERDFYERKKNIEKELLGTGRSNESTFNQYYVNANGYIFKGTLTATTSSGVELPAVSDALIKEAVSQFQRAINIYFNKENTTRNTSEAVSDDLRLSTYLTMKSLYDKWLCSQDESFWSLKKDKKSKTGYSGEFGRFYFLDSYYRNIGDSLMINITDLERALTTMLSPTNGDSSGYSPSVYEFLQLLNEKTKCLLLESPAFGSFEDIQDIEELFKPMPYNVMANTTETGPSYLWIYPHNPSAHLDMEESDYADDGFDLADSTGNISPTLPKNLFDDEGNLIRIPAFGVTFGKQNQSFFKDYSFDMTQFQNTEYGISNSLTLADSYGKSARAASYVAQDLYKVYSNYSYGVDVTMVGCASISPLMLFQLNNIPMFKGAYRITNVSHDITPGKMETRFKGVRLNKRRLPLISDIMIVSNLEKLDKEKTETDTKVKEVDTGYFKSNYNTYAISSVSNDIIKAENFDKSIKPKNGGKAHSIMKFENGISSTLFNTGEATGDTTGYTYGIDIPKILYQIGYTACKVGYQAKAIKMGTYKNGSNNLYIDLQAINDSSGVCTDALYDMIVNCFLNDKIQITTGGSTEDKSLNVSYCQDNSKTFVRISYKNGNPQTMLSIGDSTLGRELSDYTGETTIDAFALQPGATAYIGTLTEYCRTHDKLPMCTLTNNEISIDGYTYKSNQSEFKSRLIKRYIGTIYRTI